MTPARATIIAAVIAAIGAIVAAIIATTTHQPAAAPGPNPGSAAAGPAPATTAAAPPATTSAAGPTAGAVRRTGSLTLTPGNGVSLDSLAPNWDVNGAPGSEDLSVGSVGLGTGKRLGGVASPPDFATCQAFTAWETGVLEKSVQPGSAYCVETAQHRLASVAVTAADRDEFGLSRVTFAVTVWQPISGPS